MRLTDPTLDPLARDPALRERFLREARLAAKLSHPNIIPIHAVDDTGEFVYFVMAFVDGETLAHRVRTSGFSDEVERLIAGHKEVESIMRFPRETAATPV